MLLNVKEPTANDPEQSRSIRQRNMDIKARLNRLVEHRARTWPNCPPDIDAAIAEMYFKRHYFFVWRMFPINELVRVLISVLFTALSRH